MISVINMPQPDPDRNLHITINLTTDWTLTETITIQQTIYQEIERNIS